MKRLMISGLAAVALLAAATTMLRSHSPSDDRPAASKATMSPQELQAIYAAAGVNRLPIEEFEDKTLVFSAAAER